MSASLDASLDPMEEIRFRKKHGGLWAEIQKSTHFTFDELEKIMVIFFKIQKRDDKPAASDLISRAHFRDVLHTGLGMTDSYMMERVMVALDRGTSPYVTMATFGKAMSLYLRGSLEERIAYAFTCYDLLGEGYLRRETMYQLMKKSLAKASRDDDVEEAVKELVDIMLKRMDADLDGVINFNDFHISVTKTPSLLESLGYCLPERPAVYAFVSTWCPAWKSM
ncbi:PREDICTED: EF-hand calcium-binding domain-containing protein 1-like isoform X1 [Papilio polytes]|uniref:EF-hand calcium-binding domain-containing protein 1-like isoform X1 n=1 Tax=Papilio polytes TaxID=76194 RepID=UPI0006760122|nr:PREDICTED: EF-hand calcium-binding domain-containing protein 1-like isoform X1 [Papilio polytes]